MRLDQLELRKRIPVGFDVVAILHLVEPICGTLVLHVIAVGQRIVGRCRCGVVGREVAALGAATGRCYRIFRFSADSPLMANG